MAAFRTGKLDIYQMAGMTTKRDLLEVSPELETVLESRQAPEQGGLDGRRGRGLARPRRACDQPPKTPI